MNEEQTKITQAADSWIRAAGLEAGLVVLALCLAAILPDVRQ